MRDRVAAEVDSVRSCSIHVNQVGLIPQRAASSSLRSPFALRLLPTLNPTSCGCSRSRRERMKLPSEVFAVVISLVFKPGSIYTTISTHLVLA